jgi:hypothetical protein
VLENLLTADKRGRMLQAHLMGEQSKKPLMGTFTQVSGSIRRMKVCIVQQMEVIVGAVQFILFPLEIIFFQ